MFANIQIYFYCSCINIYLIYAWWNMCYYYKFVSYILIVVQVGTLETHIWVFYCYLNFSYVCNLDADLMEYFVLHVNNAKNEFDALMGLWTLVQRWWWPFFVSSWTFMRTWVRHERNNSRRSILIRRMS